ncbi:hypothetical protein D3C80_1142710 [compost metagenome]
MLRGTTWKPGSSVPGAPDMAEAGLAVATGADLDVDAGGLKAWRAGSANPPDAGTALLLTPSKGATSRLLPAGQPQSICAPSTAIGSPLMVQPSYPSAILPA